MKTEMWTKSKPVTPSRPDSRPTKRPRLSGSKPSQPSRVENTAEPTLTKDEQDFMADLLSGLDASVFDDVASSPIKSKIASQVARSPLRPVSSGPMGKRKFAKIASLPKVDIMPKAEVRSIPIQTIDIKVEKDEIALPVPLSPPGPDWDSDKTLVDDDLYTFDFDLSDLSAFDEDLLDVPVLPPKVKYPILHPDVPPPQTGYKPTPWVRCTVKHVFDGIRYEDGRVPDLSELQASSQAAEPRMINGKTLVIDASDDSGLLIVHLKERWADVLARPGDIINLISPSLSSPISITYKDPRSFMILHPDLMLTMTTIANAMPCPRKPILQSLIKIPGPSSKAILYGNLGHTLLQGALGDQVFKAEATHERLEKELGKETMRLEVWGAGMNIRDVEEEVGKNAGRGFETFGEKWVGPEPRIDGDLHSGPGDAQSLLSITGLHEIEEDIWSAKWGLKGKVDASVQASVIMDRTKKGAEREVNVAPLEIKTGRSVGVMGHRAQTMLYTLLMEDRYGVPVPAGLLYYSQLDTILRVEARPAEIRALISARNELASYLVKSRKLASKEANLELGIPATPSEPDLEDVFLPPTIDSARECKTCYAVDSCMLYRKTIDQTPTDEADPIALIYEEKMGHMTERDIAFFRKWENLLTVEEQDIGRLRKELWTMGAEEREKRGRCFSNMVIESYSNDLGKSLAKIHRHTYAFTRAVTSTPAQSGRTNLLSGHITKGDPVNISIEPDLLCLQRGFVVDLTTDVISIGVTYTIDTASLIKRTIHRNPHREKSTSDQLIFRIDKDEMTSGIAKMRNNLAQLFFVNGDVHRRNLIVHNYEPRFDPSLLPTLAEIPAGLNEDQVSAMGKVLTALDYALVLGMPGTGKTTTIAEIIKALVGRGKSVLLASYTHSAVDTILMKMLNESFGILRLGNVDKVHPDVQHLTLEAMNASTSMGQLEERLMGPPVVATTCLSIDHPLFFRRKFDYCIIDEASQITLPTILGPLRFAETFILVGDHFQLPPIVRNHSARQAGLDVSLFKMLSERRPEAVVDLRYQYRMNEDIMSLSNTLVYGGRLRVGNEEVGKRGLILLGKAVCGEKCERRADDGGCWVKDLMEENVKAVFVDTDNLPAIETRVGDLVQNTTEAILARQLVQSLLSGGVKEEDIAVITPYRQQIKVLNGLFRDRPRVEIMTADKSQGRDKDIILISLVRSNEIGNVGDLLRDWRRINVSFTRAKKKLVIFGSRKTLGSDKLLKDFLELMDGKGWIYTLKKGDEMLHPLPELEQARKEEKRDKERKVGKVGEGLIKGKAFVQEIIKSE